MTSTILPPCDSYANRSPFSPPIRTNIGDFADPREGGGEDAIAIREKACAVFSNKYFANFKRSQRLAISFETNAHF